MSSESLKVKKPRVSTLCQFLWIQLSLSLVFNRRVVTTFWYYHFLKWKWNSSVLRVRPIKTSGTYKEIFFVPTNIKYSEQSSSNAGLLSRKQLLKVYCPFVLIVQHPIDENSERSDFFSTFECKSTLMFIKFCVMLRTTL